MNFTTHHSTKKLSKKSNSFSEDLQATSQQTLGQEEKPDMQESYPDYPLYPPSEDIYSNYTREDEVDPEQLPRLKAPLILADIISQLDFKKEHSEDELDVPGSELDDEQEVIGSEDEENNYYSIGGDEHENLEENL